MKKRILSLVLALLNAAKTGEEASTWDSSSKTLTLNGIDFTTTATTALKLPDGATIVLADGTKNTIKGGDATATQTGTYKNSIYIYGIYAEGALTIKGDTAGTGALSVTSGEHTNTGDAWTYSVALYANGDLKVKGGSVTTSGGKATSADCAFSYGVELAEGGDLTVTGGTLTGIGGESVDTGNEKEYKSFSEGIDLYKGNVSVTGGKLVGECVTAMNGEGLAYGIRIISGELNISNGEISATATQAIAISGGNLKQTGGKITAVATTSETVGSRHGISVSKEFTGSSGTVNTGNIEITGGELDASVGGVYMSAHEPKEQEGLLTVSGASTNVKLGTVFDAHKFVVKEDATVTSEGITADELMLESGSLTVVEHVEKNKYYENIYNANAALSLKKLTVNGGSLNASWDWGKYQRKILQHADPLVEMLGTESVASFTGGTTILDTGCAGNTALKTETLKLGSGIYGSGYTHENSSDTYLQENNRIPVRFGPFQPKEITVSGITAQDKPYDGTDAATLTDGTLNGVDTGDDVGFTMTGVKASFSDKNVGTNKTVTVSGAFELTGADAYKYTLTQPSLDLKASITARTTFTDATDKTQFIYVGESSFEAPRFTGIGGETVEGTLVYNLADGKTEADIPAMLRSLKVGESLSVPYTFTASGNYSGEKSGTITVTAQERPASSVTPVAPSYPVTTPDSAENGSVSASRKSASKGTVVTVTVQPKAGYVLEELTVTDKNGNVLELTDKGNGQYTFTMPGSKVEIAATFMEDNSVLNFFYDVPNDAYYYEAVKWAVAQEITGGVGNNLFAPDDPCTRSQVVTFLWRAAGCPEPQSTGSFSDVAADSYYAKAVAWAAENGITGGTGEGRFSPDAPCTRGEIVTLLYRYLQSKGEGFTGNWMFLLPFTDVTEWCYEAVAWCYMKNITEGTSPTTFSPDDACTRGQIVTLLYRCMK